MKYSFSRYTFGIILGAIVGLGSITFFILECINLAQLNQQDDPGNKSKTKTSAIKSLILYAVCSIIAAVFVYGVIKRKHKLIDPWIFFCVGGVVGSLKVLISKSIDVAYDTGSESQNVKVILICVMIIVVDVAIICFSYNLYLKMREENRRKLSNIPCGEVALATEYTPVPDKY